MHAHTLVEGQPLSVYSNLETYALAQQFEDPTLILDPKKVIENYEALKAGLGHATIHYAVKANPHVSFISALVKTGSHFDAASKGEIALCLQAGATPAAISFGNTVKKPTDIAYAHKNGITLFAADSEAELEKIATHAPGASVYIRLLVSDSQADWPLSRKFGCAPDKVEQLFALATQMNLTPVGLSFHVGSQTRRSHMWRPVLAHIASVWHALQQAEYPLTLLNLGGGFPAFYGDAIEDTTTYAKGVFDLVTELFGFVPHLMAEPGRGLVANAGVITCQALLVSKKSDNDMYRWVYLDIGRFSGLAETEGEAIRYQFLTNHPSESPQGPAILAGPSCDSADVLYEKRPVMMPMALQGGDTVVIRNTGAYTSSYSSIGFNGFPPLQVMTLP